jgi:D-arabinose 1-dehydrogenase-like Zn-dependent alcohol dehydrogenase
MDVRS